MLLTTGLALLSLSAMLPAGVPDAAAQEGRPLSDAGRAVRDTGHFDPGLTVADTPSDDGSSLTLRWSTDPGALRFREPGALDQFGDAALGRPASQLVEGAELSIERREPGGEFITAGATAFADGAFRDTGLQSGEAYSYRLVLQTADGAVYHSALTEPLAPKVNWLRQQRLNALVIVLLMAALVIGFIFAAKRGASLYIRRIAGLDAIDEAIGRATEMGRKILYVPGIVSVNEIQTIASLGILGYVAKLAGQYGAELEVPNIDPLTMAAAREVVKQSYLEAGAPDAYHEGMVHYITADQFAYTAAVNGIMVRDKPATTFLIGWFAAESLLLAEIGQSVGAIQIAGTAQVTQLPFFVAACDYTMIGEELFAASAYLSRDPLLLGSIKGQDMMKALLLALIVLGVIAATIGVGVFPEWFTAR
jgi:hypothetical protein